MNKTTQHAVIIDNISSPYIEQAIIILKDFSVHNRDKIISDAEKIVSDYLKKIKTDDSDITIYNRPHKNHSKAKPKSDFRNIIICITSILAIAAAGYLLFI